MAIYAPGRRDRHNRSFKSNKRSAVAMLSLTAMVDMFTVLAVFLLQNYNTTGEVIEMDEKVALPQASRVKELQPAHVVLISPDSIQLDQDVVASFSQVQAQQDWLIQPLQAKLLERFREAEARRQALGGRLKEAVNQTSPGGTAGGEDEFKRVTVQADRKIDFLTIKKVMFTLTEAGAAEINFAVMKRDDGKVSK